MLFGLQQNGCDGTVHLSSSVQFSFKANNKVRCQKYHNKIKFNYKENIPKKKKKKKGRKITENMH